MESGGNRECEQQKKGRGKCSIVGGETNRRVPCRGDGRGAVGRGRQPCRLAEAVARTARRCASSESQSRHREAGGSRRLRGCGDSNRFDAPPILSARAICECMGGGAMHAMRRRVVRAPEGLYTTASSSSSKTVSTAKGARPRGVYPGCTRCWKPSRSPGLTRAAQRASRPLTSTYREGGSV